jgi:hypothetical protein
MNTELTDKDLQLPTEEPHEDLQSESNEHSQEPGSRVVTWTLSCLDGKVDPKAYERLKSEIEWAEVAADGTMTFKSTNADEIDGFTKKIRTIFSENEERNTVEALSFSIGSKPR